MRSQVEVRVKAGDMVVLDCQNGTTVEWTSHTSWGTNLTIDMSSAEQRQMGVLMHEESLLILSVSLNHQGNYSCSVG